MLMDAIKRTLCLRNATLGCALYLSKTHQYLLMQDRGGGIWVQHKDCRYIVPPPGGSVFQVQGRPLPFQRWLTLMHRLVRQDGRVGLDPKIPYKCAVQRLYGEHYKSNRPIVDEPLTKRSVLKALNPYIAHRSKEERIPFLINFRFNLFLFSLDIKIPGRARIYPDADFSTHQRCMAT